MIVYSGFTHASEIANAARHKTRRWRSIARGELMKATGGCAGFAARFANPIAIISGADGRRRANALRAAGLDHAKYSVIVAIIAAFVHTSERSNQAAYALSLRCPRVEPLSRHDEVLTLQRQWSPRRRQHSARRRNAERYQ